MYLGLLVQALVVDILVFSAAEISLEGVGRAYNNESCLVLWFCR